MFDIGTRVRCVTAGYYGQCGRIESIEMVRTPDSFRVVANVKMDSGLILSGGGVAFVPVR